MQHSIITQTALATLEKGINKLLMMDDAAIAQIASLEGNTITIYSTTPDYHFTIIPTVEGIFLSHTNDLPVDAELTAPATLLLQLLLTKNKEAFLRNTNVSMVGNTGLIYQFFRIMDNLSPNWEEELSQWFNPALLAVITQTIKSGNQQLKQGVAFIKSQLQQLFDNELVQPNDREHKTPFMVIMNSLEKRFKKS